MRGRADAALADRGQRARGAVAALALGAGARAGAARPPARAQSAPLLARARRVDLGWWSYAAQWAPKAPPRDRMCPSARAPGKWIQACAAHRAPKAPSLVSNRRPFSRAPGTAHGARPIVPTGRPGPRPWYKTGGPSRAHPVSGSRPVLPIGRPWARPWYPAVPTGRAAHRAHMGPLLVCTCTLCASAALALASRPHCSFGGFLQGLFAGMNLYSSCAFNVELSEAPS